MQFLHRNFLSISTIAVAFLAIAFIPTPVRAATNVLYQGTTNAGTFHAMNSVSPNFPGMNPGGTFTRARIYVQSHAGNPAIFVDALFHNLNGTHPNDTFFKSNGGCYAGTDGVGPYYDCYFNQGYTLEPGGGGYLYFVLCGGATTASCDVAINARDNNVNNGINGTGYNWYGFIDGQAYVPPATSEWLEYTYSPAAGINGSVGSTTVGVSISVPDITHIDYVGYRLVSPNGTIVYDATTTPAVAGTYTFSKDYNFTIQGLYKGYGYYVGDCAFSSDTGCVFLDNPGQNIRIDLSPWTIGNDGEFSPPNPFSSTSTIAAFSIDCGTPTGGWLDDPIGNFTTGICVASTRMLVPSAGAIQGVQGSFSVLMNYVPFSFFTQAQTFLNSFRIGSASTGGTLTMTFYGENVPIIATSSLDAVGVDSTQIDFLKFLISTGLWILLAWYLYWRIASIFGV